MLGLCRKGTQEVNRVRVEVVVESSRVILNAFLKTKRGLVGGGIILKIVCSGCVTVTPV